MNKYSYTALLLFLIIISTFVISGCANYLENASAPYVISRTPTLGATGISPNETIVITFNKEMDTNIPINDAINFELTVSRIWVCMKCGMALGSTKRTIRTESKIIFRNE